MRRLSPNDIVGNFAEVLRHESGEVFGIIPVRQMVTLKGASDEGLMDQRLIVGGGLKGLLKIGNPQTGGKGVGRGMRRNRLSLRADSIHLVRENDLAGRIQSGDEFAIEIDASDHVLIDPTARHQMRQPQRIPVLP